VLVESFERFSERSVRWQHRKRIAQDVPGNHNLLEKINGPSISMAIDPSTTSATKIAPAIGAL